MHLQLATALRATALTVLLAASTLGVCSAATDTTRTASEDSWQVGRQWLSLRAGHARSAVKESASGNIGYGIGYGRMLSGLQLWKYRALRNTSANVHLHYDVLGRFGDASEIEVPLTVEILRHFRWAPAVHPYLGFGVGAYYRKLYRTGQDFHDTNAGWHFATGVNTPLDDHRVLGLDLRIARLDATNPGGNPVFGPGDDGASHWSIKANYAITY